ncbi:MAG TPA: ATP-dependent DNA ligase [Candidatus Methanofastidiosa archaeon]|nr:ATP-dependent DNA ligase [Candidatus Methanofastidiosa archaeon]
MEFATICDTFEDLERTSSRLEKTEMISKLLKGAAKEDLEMIIRLLLGRVFPSWSTSKIGVGEKLLIKATSDISGIPEGEIVGYLKETGDVGLSIERAMENKKQVMLASRDLDLVEVYNSLVKLSTLDGKRSQDRKLKILAGILTNASPKESRYISRTVVETMRTGVAEGTIRDSVAKAFEVPPSKVEKAFMLSNDFGLVALKAFEGEKALDEVSLELFRPIKMMSAQKVSSAEEGFKVAGRPCALEYKYDGFRMQIHKQGDRISIFTRRLENVTEQFKDVVEAVSSCLRGDCIVEGETIGISSDGKWLPFQNISRRIKRKYNIDEVIEKIPVMTNLFDILFLNGDVLIDRPFAERRELLESIVTPDNKRLSISRMIHAKEGHEVEEFFKESIEKGNEGVMIKNLTSPYVPGLRVGNMLKLKSVLESLDCIVTAAEWGSGRRARHMGTFYISILDENGEPARIGKVATGITDEMLDSLTERLRPLIISEEGTLVNLRPELVIEVAYEEIQKSPTYESGFALRFPRLIRLRDDKGPGDADTIERVYDIYEKDGAF